MESSARQALLQTLEHRFKKNMHRHASITWKNVMAALDKKPTAIQALYEMESTGGEPDVLVFGESENTLNFVDCSNESPMGRRSLCYDEEALQSRKENKPAGSALGMATRMGLGLLTEQQYRALQQMGEFDTKTSSWIATPPDVRKLGGALFCDRRYATVFTYHNGASSYYAARGFRGVLPL